MRVPAAILLLSLLAAFHAPLAAAASPRMDCCAGGMTQMCCPLEGSRSMRRCADDGEEAALSTMSVFLLPAAAAPLMSAYSWLVPGGWTSSPVSEAPSILDPPPRG